MESVSLACRNTGRSVRQVLSALGVQPSSYYRWMREAVQAQPKPQTVRPQGAAPTPEEEADVRGYALKHPALGYKRLTWQMLDADVAALRPHQVYQLLGKLDLIVRRPREAADALKRPAPPTRPDEVWHIDLMYVSLSGQWYYLVDVVDGYSRFLVHWSLNTTMLAETVTITVQQALDRLVPKPKEPPRIVHDHGSQFVSAEWRSLIQSTGLADIKTRVAHPQSNGVVERLHRTHREEAALDQDMGYHQALERFTKWSDYYNNARPHSALQYLCPRDYYRGDPGLRIAQRQDKLAAAKADRIRYWHDRLT
jgi:transposase InsO family protein